MRGPGVSKQKGSRKLSLSRVDLVQLFGESFVHVYGVNWPRGVRRAFVNVYEHILEHDALLGLDLACAHAPSSGA